MGAGKSAQMILYCICRGYVNLFFYPQNLVFLWGNTPKMCGFSGDFPDRADGIASVFQLVQIQGEALDTVAEEPVQAGHFHFFQGGPGALGGGGELLVACFQLLYTFNISREFVCGLDGAAHAFILLVKQRAVTGPQLRRQHGKQGLAADLLHFFVGVPDLRIVVLDGGGQIPGKDLRRIVKQRRSSAPVRVGVAAQDVPVDHGKPVGQHRHHVTVLLDVFPEGVAHETPAADVPQPGDESKKSVLHDKPPEHTRRRGRREGYFHGIINRGRVQGCIF